MKKLTTFAIIALLVLTCSAFANQVGINFTQDNVGVLGDYEHKVSGWEFATDAQAQFTDTRSLIANASIQRSFGSVGLQPFIAYNKDEFGGVVDVGGVVNFSIGSLDISAGASFRGADPVADGGLDGFDRDGNPVKYYTSDPSNTYSLPDVNNINAVGSTEFENWGVETKLTGYFPLTEREIVPVVLISRSQTSIEIADGLGLSIVFDARTYVHADGAEVSIAPQGAITYKF